jgi:hypothetical protein
MIKGSGLNNVSFMAQQQSAQRAQFIDGLKFLMLEFDSFVI